MEEGQKVLEPFLRNWLIPCPVPLRFRTWVTGVKCRVGEGHVLQNPALFGVPKRNSLWPTGRQDSQV